VSSRSTQALGVLALSSLSVGSLGCPGPSATEDAGFDAGAAPAEDAASGAGSPDPGHPWEAEVTPASCRPRFEGLSAPVEVIRDADGVPHVYGATTADAQFGSGYMQATDRLLQMELARRRALGTRAAILGEGSASDDTLMRILGIGRWGAVNASAMARESPELYVQLDAWAAGVNRRLEEIRSGEIARPVGFGPTELDFVPEPWTVDDALAVGKLVLFGNASQIEYDILSSIIRQYVPDLWSSVPLYLPIRDAHSVPPEERPPEALIWRGEGITPQVPGALPEVRELPPDAAERMRAFFARFADVPGLSPFGGASNNWAVDGRHTVDGTPMIAGDPHQGFSSPNIFWLHHQHSARPEDRLDVIGWSFLGSPGVQLGHNRQLSWTATTTYPDVMDLWAVRGDADSVSIGGSDRPLVVRTETIEVHDGAPVEIQVESVPGFGVILPRDLAPLPIVRVGERILFNWVGFARTHEAEQFTAYARAGSLDDFDAAADAMEIGTFNFVAADASGITYRSSPAVPVRAGPVTEERSPWTILDGDDEGSLWTGSVLGPSQLPHSRGGMRGWLATANNEPFGLNDDGDWFDGPFYFGMYFDPGTRAQRVEDELARVVARGDVTLEDMQALQDDTHSLLADDLVPALLAVWDARATDASLVGLRDRADLDALVTALRGWDRRMERGSPEAVIFNAYMYLLTRRLLADEFSAVFDPILEAEPMYVLKMTSLVVRAEIDGADAFFDEGRSLTMVQALSDTASWLLERFGGTETSRYTWGDVHGAVFRSVRGDALQTEWVSTDGADGTVNVAKAQFLDGAEPRDRMDVGGGACYRMVARFRDDGTPEAFFQMPRGVSGTPGDPFYDNLADDWVEGRYRRLRYERAEVEDGAAETIMISP